MFIFLYSLLYLVTNDIIIIIFFQFFHIGKQYFYVLN